MKLKFPSASMVVATGALVLAAAGGATAAETGVLGIGSVHTRNIHTGAVTSQKIHQGAVSIEKLSQGVRGMLARVGTAGAPGAQGPKGDKGDTGATGAQGPAGPAGKNGTNGTDGTNAQALPYGIGEVLVNTGTGAVPWASYSTTLGSPVGDTTSGTFRFTCKNTAGGCDVSVQAYTTASGYAVYPRLLIYKSGPSGNDSQYCEYADGADNDNDPAPVGTSATPVELGIGVTLDCGSTVQTTSSSDVTKDPQGQGFDVSEINVPGATGVGEHYDVFTTLVFVKANAPS